MNFIRKWLWRKNAVRVAKTRIEDCKSSLQTEIMRRASDWASMLDAVTPTYDGYVEYAGKKFMTDGGWVDRYELTNSRNVAETLMWDRIRAKHGSSRVEVTTLDVPYPWNGYWVRYAWVCGEHDRIKNWRLYYKVNEVS